MIYAYGDRRWGAEQAAKYQRALYAAFDLLAEGRRVGRPVIQGSAYRKFAVGSHYVVSRQHGPALRIVRVLHQRMDIRRHLR